MVEESLTKKVAFLSRLYLSDAEVKAFTPQLEKILKYIEQLSTVDTEGVKPLFSPVEWSAPERKDVAHPGPKDEQGKPKVLSSAPETLYEGFKVPPIL
jgi:aspartyl-tRNA(Asn)/glutamyl-tRNA(Gln) amidotransferase subunit C